MENFNVGEVVWAKIRGYPWWPGYIRGIEDDNKEKKFVVQFIGDNTFSNIPKKQLTFFFFFKKQLGKFEKEYEIHSNTKKKDLKESIKIALDMYKNKKGIDFLEKSNNLLKRKFRKENDDDNNSENSSSVNNSSSEKNNFDGKNKNNNNNNNEKIFNNNNVNYSNKRKKKDEKNGNEILNKISLYLHKIVVEIYKDKLNLDVVKVCLIKVLKFLKEFKLNDPIDFLKKSGVGKCVKYIKEKINDNEIKDLSNEVYKNLEDQVLQQIFPKK